jgi:hypothetical protein
LYLLTIGYPASTPDNLRRSPPDLHTISKLRNSWPESIEAMKNIVVTPLTSVALGAAALALAGTAIAFPTAGTAADVVDSLKTEGYNVQVNGLVQVPLKLCAVTDVHPRLDDASTLEEKQHTQVFVDVSCPSHD